MNDKGSEWSVDEAAAHLPEVVDLALKSPQRIAATGDRSVIVISAAEYNRLAAEHDSRPSLAAFLAEAPLAELDLDRSTDLSRNEEP